MLMLRAAVAAVVALAVALPTTTAPAQPASGPETNRARAGKDLPPLAPAARDALTRALTAGRLTEAEYALQRVRSLLDLRGVRRDFGSVEAPDPHHATLLFRDLALRVDELEGEERDAAEYLLARPDDGTDDGTVGNLLKYEGPSQVTCADPPVGVCVHRAVQGPHFASTQQVADTLATLTTVWTEQITGGGFRSPKPDHQGPDASLDVYLADVGSLKFYGYCTTDDPNVLENKIGTADYPYFDASAYCVLDNDYAEGFFGDPVAALQVTAAHEFFHAVQFGYDAFEDFWLMEGTAAAIEDHVYDDINDNYQFLSSSQMIRPQVSTDLTNENTEYAFMHRYGAWIFWRFMSERLDEAGVPNVSVLREVWRHADAAKPRNEGDPEPPDRYSAKAAVAAANTFGAPFRRMFADYGVALQLPDDPSLGFVEGSGYLAFLQAQSLSRKTTHKAIELRPAAPRARWGTKVNHLAHKYAAVTKNNAAAGRRMRVILDLPPKKRGAMATLLPFAQDGTFLGMRRISLDGQGDGKITVGPKVQRAVVALTNGSTRFACWQGTFLSCQGKARDNGLTYDLRARLLR